VTTLGDVLARPEVARLVDALGGRGARVIDEPSVTRRAAVALVLRPGAAGAPEVLMIKRAEAEGDPWSGHVALPGGRIEPADRDLEDTAVRETLEETGINLRGHGRVLGALDEVRPRNQPQYAVRPYVAVVLPDVTVLPSHEVAAAFWVPLALLREPTAWGEETIVVRGEPRRVACFRHGPYVVWGLTERILSQFVALLTALPPARRNLSLP
jgi:8-oxo-dGTP pyrophosphatase MutT (NUDIX family)